MRPHRLIAAALLVGLAGCWYEVPDLEDKACDDRGQCAPGYRCVAGRCVSSATTLDAGAGDATPVDRATADAATEDGWAPDGGPPDGPASEAGSGDGGSADAATADGGPATQVLTLVAAGSTWRYLDDGSDQGTAWRAPAFDDSAWSAGPAPLGFGNGDEATVVSYGTDAAHKHITTYFRQRFEVANLAGINLVLVRLARDDGAVVYLNGVEVLRSNLAPGTLDATTLAADAREETALHTFALDPARLVVGSNSLAVEVHQYAPFSSDLRLDLELVAHVRAPSFTSCREALRAGVVASGAVLLDPDGPLGPAAPAATWCEQVVQGGGWALALKIDGARATFRGDAPTWTSNMLMPSGGLGPTNLEEAKLEPYLSQAVGAVMLRMSTGDEPSAASTLAIALRAPSLHAAVAAGNFVPTTLSLSAWRALLPVTSLQGWCPRQGLNGRSADGTLLRLGLAGSGDAECSGSQSWLGLGPTLACADASQPVAGNAVADGAGADNGLVCQPAFAWVYVRDDDFTHLPAEPSCADHLLQARFESGRYLIDPHGGSPTAVHCDMERAGGGWTAVLDFDVLRDPCPAPLVNASGAGAPIGCNIAATDVSASLGHLRAPLPSFGEVLGHALAYQLGSMDAFESSSFTIDDNYVDGISVTLGSPRRHLMTFALGQADRSPGCPGCGCPCVGGTPAQAYVGDAYRCESGARLAGAYAWFPQDPVWDGVDGPPGAGCTAEASGEPIVVDLGAMSSDPLEVRVLRDEPPGVGDTEGLALYRLQIYVR